MSLHQITFVQQHFHAGLIAAVVLLLASGCGQQGNDQPLTRLRLGHVYEVRSPTHAFGVSKLNDRLAAAGAQLQLTVFPAAQLGSESELLEQLVAGEIDIAIAGPSFLAMWHSPLGAFDAAYAFRDTDHMQSVADGPLMAQHWEALRTKYGVRVLATWPYGSRHITGSRPVRRPEDLRGFRLRMPGAKVWQESGKALGASPMPMAFSEVYMALQQGIADGQENPVPVIHSMGFHEVQPYLSLTSHIQSSVQVLVNERSWQRLRPGDQQALADAAKQLADEIQQGLEQQEAELLDQWRQDGQMTIVDDCDLAAFRQRAREYFEHGFVFSDLYRQITSQAEPQPDTAP